DATNDARLGETVDPLGCPRRVEDDAGHPHERRGDDGITSEGDDAASRDLATVDRDPVRIVDLRPCVRRRVVGRGEREGSEEERERNGSQGGPTTHRRIGLARLAQKSTSQVVVFFVLLDVRETCSNASSAWTISTLPMPAIE